MTRVLVVVLAMLLIGGICGLVLVLRRTSVEGTSAVTDPTQGSPPGAQPPHKPDDVQPHVEQPLPSKEDDRVDLTEQLRTFESIMDRFVRQDPVVELQASVKQLVEDHNQWVTQRKAEFETQRRELDKQVGIVRSLETDIESLGERLNESKPDPASREAITAYNDLVSRRNELVTKHRELAAICQKNQTALKAAVDRVNRETAKREEQVESAKRDAESQVKTYRQWRESGQDDDYWKQLNGFYAHLYEQSRRHGNQHSGPQKAEWEECLPKVRSMRGELGERFAQRQADRQEGLIAVRATLCGVEDCFYIVDTGATLVTISPSLVRRLDLADHVGDQIEVSLAGNIRIKAPQITIPQVTVFGMTAHDIKGIVLDEPSAGADGLLGMSFLSRFNYRIDAEGPNRLILEARSDE